MLYWALAFFVVAITAAIFGFGGLSSTAVDIAKTLFVVFLVLFVTSLLWAMIGERTPPARQ